MQTPVSRGPSKAGESGSVIRTTGGDGKSTFGLCDRALRNEMPDPWHCLRTAAVGLDLRP